MGELGRYESFAFDDSTTIFYVSRDTGDGVVYRWCTLANGAVDYLLTSGDETGTFNWTTDLTAAQDNARAFYPNSEGIDANNGMLFFVSKKLQRLVTLNLAARTYSYSSTISGAFADEPDQVGRLIKSGNESFLYLCEDGGNSSGVFGRAADGRYFTVMEGRTDGRNDESTGLGWSPDALHMYVTYQSECA